MELLNDKAEELMDLVQNGKRDLIVLNQESAARTRAAAKAWRAYEERTAAYFRFRQDRSRAQKVWPSDLSLKRSMWDHWLWITATRVMHMRGLRVIFDRLYYPLILGGFSRFAKACFRGLPSRLRGKGGAPKSALQQQLLDEIDAEGSKGSGGGDGGGAEDAAEAAETAAEEAKRLRARRAGREIRSIGDLGLARVLDGRETLLDELRCVAGPALGGQEEGRRVLHGAGGASGSFNYTCA